MKRRDRFGSMRLRSYSRGWIAISGIVWLWNRASANYFLSPWETFCVSCHTLITVATACRPHLTHGLDVASAGEDTAICRLDKLYFMMQSS